MISIILPCYNPDRQYLIECIKSIKRQSYYDYELIIINDGSDKPYSDFIKKIVITDQRFRLIEQENKGVSETRNRGVKEAKGKYILFVDADDILMEGFLEEALNIAIETEADVIQGSTFYLNGKIKAEEKTFSYKVLKESDKRDIIIQMLDVSKSQYNNIGNNKGKIARGPWCKLIRKESAEETLFNSRLYLGEDRVWNLELIENSKKVCIVYRNWYIYRSHGKSVSHKFDHNRINSYGNYLNAIRRIIPDEHEIILHYQILVFEVFCELLDGHFFNPLYPDKKNRKVNIHILLEEDIWNEINRLNYAGLSKKRMIMLFLIKHHFFTLYHYIRKFYLYFIL